MRPSLWTLRRHFPPGALPWKDKQPRSLWREFAFMHHQIMRAIDPPLKLRNVLARWNRLAVNLAESPRKRSAQLSRHFKV